MRIALAQIDCRLGNIPANLETHRAALKTINEKGGADFVLFPELSLTGYRLRSNIHRVMLHEEELTDQVDLLRADLALAPETVCALGYIELTNHAVVHNTTAIVSGSTACTLFSHRKVYLPTYGMFEEERYTRPGKQFRSLDYATDNGEKWRIGVLTCEDAWHSSAWTILQARGVDLIVVPSASPGRGVESDRLGSQKSWYGILSTYAEMTGCWIAYCNRVGFEDDIHFWGGSAVFSPTGEIVAQAALMDPDLLICEIDKRAITTARIATPLSAVEEWDMTISELKHAREEAAEE